MQHLTSNLDYSVSEPENPVDTLHFRSKHGIAPFNPVFQAQLACKPDVLRFNSVFLATTRLLNAQATKRR